jgi:hypothetical protein
MSFSFLEIRVFISRIGKSQEVSRGQARINPWFPYGCRLGDRPPPYGVHWRWRGFHVGRYMWRRFCYGIAGLVGDTSALAFTAVIRRRVNFRLNEVNVDFTLDPEAGMGTRNR